MEAVAAAASEVWQLEVRASLSLSLWQPLRPEGRGRIRRFPVLVSFRPPGGLVPLFLSLSLSLSLRIPVPRAAEGLH